VAQYTAGGGEHHPEDGQKTLVAMEVDMTVPALNHLVGERTLVPQPTATIRDTIAMADVGPWMATAFGEVMAYLGEIRSAPAGPPFARYFSMPGETIDVESGFPVIAPVAPRGRIVASELPGGPAAVTTHMGSYETLDTAYAAIQEWMAEHGRQPGGPFWEVYFTDPNEVPDPAQWRTEVYQPLAP